VKYLPIGTRVHFTHRACSVKRNLDMEPNDWANFGTKFTPRDSGHVVKGDVGPPVIGLNMKPPTRVDHNDKPYELDRWVYVWPDEGEGTICGLVFRAEGKWASDGGYGGYDGDYGYVYRYLSETARYPLYQLRATMRGRTFLVPTFAVRPIWLVHHYAAEEVAA
jgi:hypothetical protein